MNAVRAFLKLTGASIPIVQAPMAGFADSALAIAAIKSGGIGSLACAMLTPDQIAAEVAAVRVAYSGPLNLNFFCHTLGEAPDDTRWRATLAPFYALEGITPSINPLPLRRPFDATMAQVVEATRPTIVSFHFGLPDDGLLAQVKASGALIFGNATSVAEARALADRGCDAIIAQGFEAGGHAGYFLQGHQPIGLFALLPQIVDAVTVPVIAAGGIGDARGVRAALALGAGAVQIGTAYLRTPEARTSMAHRKRLETASADDSVITNLFSGGLARGLCNRLTDGLGPVSKDAPSFPHASAAISALRQHAEADGRADYSPLWTGQGAHAPLCSAADLTQTLGAAALATKEPDDA